MWDGYHPQAGTGAAPGQIVPSPTAGVLLRMPRLFPAAAAAAAFRASRVAGSSSSGSADDCWERSGFCAKSPKW